MSGPSVSQNNFASESRPRQQADKYAGDRRRVGDCRERMEGKMGVQSVHGEGSQYWFDLRKFVARQIRSGPASVDASGSLQGWVKRSPNFPALSVSSCLPVISTS